ncbi:MAG: amidohydrolase family protein [Telmatospirillum sp.]|nr:amidohydrolase family protein [Telmatospirillum sp.]
MAAASTERVAIEAGWLVAWDGAQHVAIEGGRLVFRDRKILFAGDPTDPACPPADRTIDAGDKLVTPGLVNLHCIANLDAQVLRSDANVPGVPKPLAYVRGGDEPHYWNAADLRASAEYAMATLLKNGTTSFAMVTGGAAKLWDEHEGEPDAIADAADRFGVRAWIAHFFREAVDALQPDGTRTKLWDEKRAFAGLERNVALIERLRARGNPRLTGFLFPYQAGNCSADLLRETMRQARALGNVHVRTHIAEYAEDLAASLARHGKAPLEWLIDTGMVGANVCLTHAIYTRDFAEVEALARTGISVCHCPLVNAREGDLLASFDRYRAAGINLGIGTDTFPPDLVEEMRVGSLLCKVADKKRGAGSVAAFFHAATIGGATALARPDLGRLAAGAAADICIWNVSEFRHGPADDPMRSLVHFGSGRDCDTVIVAGREVLKGGKIPGLDEAELMRRAQVAWDKYKRRLASWAGDAPDRIYPSALPMRRRP